MYQVSERFIDAIANSGIRKTIVDIYYGTLLTPILSNVPVISGNITVDRSARSRRSGTINIGDPYLFPNLQGSGLEPYGIEMTIKTGVVYQDGTEELIPMGIFIIDEVSAEESDGRLPTLTFYDRANRVWETSTFVTDQNPGQSWAGKMAVDALEDIITYPAPGFPNNPLWGLTIDSELVPNNYKIPGGAYEGDEDRWSMADSISNGLGGEIYFDVFGQAHCRPPPVITPDTDINQSVWTVAADQGDNSGVLISAARSISRSGVYNAVIVNGSAPKEGDPVPSAVVYDLDPRSKTYWNGPFGKKTLRISNSNLTTAGMCQISAKSTLRNVLGLSRSVSFTSLCNPALEAGDIIKVIYSDNTIELHLIDSVSIPLGSGSSKMTAQTRTINYV